MDGKRFDDLSISLATRGLSRRRFSQRLGGGLLGAALGGLGLGQTLAQGGNAAAAKWCKQQFSGKAAGQCTSAAAQGGGPYYECGPGGDGSLVLCGTTCAECCSDDDCPSGTCNPDGTCSTPITCEEQGLKTCGDTCIATTECCGGCASGQTCVDGTCEDNQQVPATCSGDSSCGQACLDADPGSCQCGRTIQGSPVCYNFMTGVGCAGHSCGGDGDCAGDYGPDSVCILGFCTTPANYCASDDGCAPGYACVNRNLGCGGCDNYTGGTLGICTPICYAN